MAKTETAWYVLSKHQVLKKLDSQSRGLTSSEAQKRLIKYGPNVLQAKERWHGAKVFFSQFKSALIYILIIAGFLSLLSGEYVDAYVIWTAVFLNVIVGFVQEYKANQALQRLNKIVKQTSLLWRDDHEELLDSQFLVPGDVIILRAGDRVSADARVLMANDLQVNESSLTGESLPVKKEDRVLPAGTLLAERSNLVFMGTLVVEGSGQAVVVNTGLRTEIGQISRLLKSTQENRTPLQLKLDVFAKNITKIILLVAAFLFAWGSLQGYPLANMFALAVAVAVSAIPEGLSISLMMILTIGMQRILKHKGLVRQLISAETLGSTTVICTDKTGTLTEGEMRVTELITSSHHFDWQSQGLRNITWDKELEKSIQIAWLCNDAAVANPQEPKDKWMILGTPTEKALLLSSINFGAEKLFKDRQRKSEVPFDSRYKFMLTRYRADHDRDLILVKGAPEKVFSLAHSFWHENKSQNLTPQALKKWHEQAEHLLRRGLRVLAGAMAVVPRDYPIISAEDNLPDQLTVVCLWGLSDPLRLAAKATLQDTAKAGIKTVIITGDNKFTAHHIAQSLGLNINDDEIITGSELLKLSDEQLFEKITTWKVYARVTPADKLRIVKAWQQRGEVVAMTGDGVNDAPAIKAADVGVSVSSGSDIAKETADLILLDNNFSTIVMAVKEGRVIFANIRKVILYLLSDSFSEMVIIIGSLIFALPLPLTAGQILWINLVSDGLPALALTTEPEDKDIMDKRPHQPKQLLGFEHKFLMVVISLVTGLLSAGLFAYMWVETGNLDLAQTMAFMSLGLGTLVYVFSIKSLEKNIFASAPFKNRYLNIAVLVGLILQFLAVYNPVLNHFLHTVPLSWYEWSLIITLTLLSVVVIEIMKFVLNIYYKKKDKK
ncbi:MAG: HAD-IC family P-type ATPase [Patescibacteria group bacterium]